MSYYDDLGVPTNASPENIRESYHALARLLHPDAQQDAGLRVAAEAQMRRINQGYAVLRDTTRRRRYDSEMMLGAGRTSPAVIRPLRHIKKSSIPFGALAWVAAALACCGVIYWLSGQGQSSVGHAPVGIQDDVPYPLERQPTLVNPAPATAQRGVSSREDRETILFLRRELQIVRAQRDAALAERRTAGASKTRMDEPAPMESLPVVAIPPPEDLFATIARPGGKKLPEPASFQNSDFAGFWIYPKTKNAVKDAKLYPPDYIEASIVEHDGTIRGKYRARYNVSDRAISPNVDFVFEGKATGPLLTLPWKGDGGANGDVEIKLLSKTEMEVNWKATNKGRSLGLINGIAVLMRRPD